MKAKTAILRSDKIECKEYLLSTRDDDTFRH